MTGKIRDHLGEAAVFLGASLWGCIGVFARSLTAAGFTPVQTVALRAVLTALMLFVYLLVFHRDWLKIRLRDLWIFLGTGLCSFVFFNTCYMNSIEENSLSVACILMYTSPFWVLFLSALLFREKLTARKLISLVIVFAGCVLVCVSPSLRLSGIGLLYGLLSGFGYALYSIFGKFAAGKYHPLTITFYTFLFAAVGILPFCGLPALCRLVCQPANWGWILGIAVINTVLPYLLYTYGLSKTTPGKAAVIAIVEPVVASLTGVLAFGETMGWPGVAGIALVVLGLCILEIRVRKKQAV